MTESIDLDAIEARLAAATPGPWDTDGTTVWAYVIVPDPRDQTGQTPIQDRELVAQSGGADADLIAHAPTDLAALVAEVRALRAVAKAAGEYLRAPSTYDDLRGVGRAGLRLRAALDALDAGGEG